MTKQFILMADIVESRKLDGEIVMSQLKTHTKKINENFRKEILSPLTITLGDEFQGIVKSIHTAIRIILAFEELILKEKAGYKLRYVVNFGEIETPVNTESAHEMLGSGLTEARVKLTSLKKEPIRFLIITKNQYIDALLNTSLKLYQHFVDSWRERDYDLIYLFLELKDYKLVAKKCNKDVSLMWRRHNSLKIEEYLEIKKLILLISENNGNDIN